jgi:protein-S-isoprenylcysteine O-methyltransferase Ste14
LSVSERTESEARDRAQFILGAVSLVLWFAVAFGLAIAWFVDDNTPQPIFMAGGIALIVAAIPWLLYRPLVRHLRRGTARRTRSA